VIPDNQTRKLAKRAFAIACGAVICGGLIAPAVPKMPDWITTISGPSVIVCGVILFGQGLYEILRAK
jgi:hypothetical protein